LSRLLSELEFGAFLAYAPHGTEAESIRSRRVVRELKEDRLLQIGTTAIRMPDFAVQRLGEELKRTPLEPLFGADVTLVPAPRSSPLPKHGLWPALRICEAMRAAGLAGEVLACVARVAAVAKSAHSKGQDRPKASQHLESLRVERELLAASRVLVVDDVVTRGATLLATASLVHEAFPKAEIRAFALVRTISPGDVEKILDPCRGVIELRGGDTFRRP